MTRKQGETKSDYAKRMMLSDSAEYVESWLGEAVKSEGVTVTAEYDMNQNMDMFASIDGKRYKVTISQFMVRERMHPGETPPAFDYVGMNEYQIQESKYRQFKTTILRDVVMQFAHLIRSEAQSQKQSEE